MTKQQPLFKNTARCPRCENSNGCLKDNYERRSEIEFYFIAANIPIVLAMFIDIVFAWGLLYSVGCILWFMIGKFAFMPQQWQEDAWAEFRLIDNECRRVE